MSFVKKYSTQIFLVLVAVLAVFGLIFWGRLSLVRKLVTGFAVLGGLHEIEEKIWPGGFYDLMLKKFGIDKSTVDLDRPGLIVSVYWLILLIPAYVFHSHPVFMAVLIALSFFEAFIHTAGIKIHKLKKPYTPGLVTAWCMAAFSVASIILMKNAGLTTCTDYLIGVPLWILSFICLARTVYSGFGKSFKDIIAMARSQK